MADPLSLAVSIVILVTKTFVIVISKEIHCAVEQIAKAPKHTKELAGDLEDFYSILRCLKGYLEDAEMSTVLIR
jgi:hypothetical protein